jgi:hypothetical protein
MKQIIIFFLAFFFTISAYCQVSKLEEGNQCFDQGDYSCAEAKYKEAFKTELGRERQIAEIKLQRTKRCIEILKKAELAYNNKNYTKANEFYLTILDSNPKDEFVKGRLESIKKKIYPPIKKPTITKTQLPETTKIQVPEIPDRLSLSKTEVSYRSSGGNEFINVNTNLKSYNIELLPSWCTVRKYDYYFIIDCSVNNLPYTRTSNFIVRAGSKSIWVNILQDAATPVKETIKLVDNNQVKNNNSIDDKKKKSSKKYNRGLTSFTSIGIQSGGTAKFGFIYEQGSSKKIGFRFSARTSLTAEKDILNGINTKNKTEIELGPNFSLTERFYINLGVGYGYYNRLMNNDYSGEIYLEKTGYSVLNTGVMYRLSNLININGGTSFMNINKEIYTPEIIFGVSFNFN